MKFSAPEEVRGSVDNVLRQFMFENNTPALRQQVLEGVEIAIAAMKLPAKYEVVLSADQKDIDNNTLNLIVRERSAVDRLGELTDE